MRILHTADWHVGKGLPGHDRADEHRAVLGEIAEVAREERVDAVLVAGDLFDSAAPSPEAERIVYEALLELSRSARVIVIAGNHDNERRLAAIRPLFELANVAIHPHVLEGGRPLEFETASGERARVALLPWVSQRHVVRAEQLMNKEASELSGQYAERMKRILARLAEGFAPDSVNLLLGHVTVAGSEMGGGERTAQTVFDYWVEPLAFSAHAHYVALGHIHKMQRIAGPCPIHYCGSPLQLDFSDKDGDRFALVVAAAANNPAEVCERKLSSPKRLRTIAGALDQLRALSGTTNQDYLRVVLRERARAGLGDEVRELFPNAVKVVLDSPETAGVEESKVTRAEASPRVLFEEYLAARNIEDQRMLSLFDRLYEESLGSSDE